MTEIIKQYLKECEAKRFELFHDIVENHEEAGNYLIRIDTIKEILKRIEVKK